MASSESNFTPTQSFVVACGVRKMWARELEDMDDREQIRRIRQILTDLGMTGRMSLEKAKSIRAKREFAQELGTQWVQMVAYV